MIGRVVLHQSFHPAIILTIKMEKEQKEYMAEKIAGFKRTLTKLHSEMWEFEMYVRGQVDSASINKASLGGEDGL